VGNRAVAQLLQRVTGDPRTEDVSEFYLRHDTPAQLRQDAAAIVSDLEGSGLDPARRMTEEQNLDTFEAYAAAHNIALPAATAHHLRQVATSLIVDGQAINGLQRELYDDIGEGLTASLHHPASQFGPDLEWSLDQLEWVVDTTKEAMTLSGSGKFVEAGRALTAAMAVAKAVATHLRYLQVGVSVKKSDRDLGVVQKVRMVRSILNDYVLEARHPAPDVSAKGVAELFSPYNSMSFDFSSWVDDLQERAEANDRFMKWVGIIQLGLLLFDIWALPVAGAPRGGGGGGGGGPVRVPVGGGGGVSVAVASDEVLESLRRLAALGLLTAPSLVKLIGGSAPAIQGPPKAMQTGGGGGAGAGKGGGGGAGHGPLEGTHEHPVTDAKGDLITDIDLIENDTLWEKKSAVNAGDVTEWVKENVTAKFEAYLKARDRLPAYYRNAKIGFIFEEIPKEALWNAIMDEIERLQGLHPDVLDWYIDS
jgi:hypothetical protein